MVAPYQPFKGGFDKLKIAKMKFCFILTIYINPLLLLLLGCIVYLCFLFALFSVYIYYCFLLNFRGGLL